uniref:Uncharacterized protein n=1 Tax=Hyaloperonospora arabidopsidis (strain Emoy2) TaxID=559515 RepID=M4BGK3_HYAAE
MVPGRRKGTGCKDGSRWMRLAPVTARTRKWKFVSTNGVAWRKRERASESVARGRCYDRFLPDELNGFAVYEKQWRSLMKVDPSNCFW